MKIVELLVQDVLRMRYFSADSKMKELKSKYSDKETVDMHFHP